jgi:hypothetical protein
MNMTQNPAKRAAARRLTKPAAYENSTPQRLSKISGASNHVAANAKHKKAEMMARILKLIGIRLKEISSLNG